jgi:hypothetical protein
MGGSRSRKLYNFRVRHAELVRDLPEPFACHSEQCEESPQSAQVDSAKYPALPFPLILLSNAGILRFAQNDSGNYD